MRAAHACQATCVTREGPACRVTRVPVSTGAAATGRATPSGVAATAGKDEK